MTKDMKSTANMTLEDLARELPRLQELAKALWGKGSNGWDKISKDGKAYTDHWQFHLQQLVVADNPIKYLEETLNG